MAADFPLGGLSLPTNTRYMLALASFFILFRLDLASLLWKIYLWVGFFVTDALQFDQVTGDGRIAGHSRPMPPFAGHSLPVPPFE